MPHDREGEEPAAGPATTAVAAGGEELGPVTAVFEDDHTGRAEIAAVGLPDGERLVPLAGVRPDGPRLQLAVTADAVRASAVAEGVDHVDHDDVVELYRHHGLSPADDTARGPAAPA